MLTGGTSGLLLCEATVVDDAGSGMNRILSLIIIAFFIHIKSFYADNMG